MDKWGCTVCGYVCDSEEGDPENGIPPGTVLGELLGDWVYPVCGSHKVKFLKLWHEESESDRNSSFRVDSRLEMTARHVGTRFYIIGQLNNNHDYIIVTGRDRDVLRSYVRALIRHHFCDERTMADYRSFVLDCDEEPNLIIVLVCVILSDG
ncbi:MAG: rubredoxin [Methanomassiliicoccales archaeon]|nr:rubredoxin [Methanomassiliicoccales archaeon]NYT15612.1 rubredoxin [Methanomassiliicoccales archaeon]